MLRSIDFKTMPYLFTNKAGTCLTVEFDGRELDSIYKQVKAMYDQAHSSDDMPTEPGWYVTRDGEDLLSFDGDAWHIHNIDCDAQLFVDGDLETMDWSVVKRTFDADAFPLIPVNLNDTSRAERRLTNLTNFLHTLIHECETVHHCLRFAFFRVVCVDRRVVHRRLDGKTLLDHIQTRRNRRDKTIKETK